ncbi:MAG: lytic transglycosylase domain-containing protein [Chloroflexota bacterium]
MLSNLTNTMSRIQSILSRFSTGTTGSASTSYASRQEEARSPERASLNRSRPIPRRAVPDGHEFNRLVEHFAARADLPESLVHAVIKAESNYDPKAVSPAGAKGLMQLMDGTAAGLGVTEPFDPVQNIAGGTSYLREMLGRFKSVPLALAAYNAGPGAVTRYGGIPPYAETEQYVRRVMDLQRQYATYDLKEWAGDV